MSKFGEAKSTHSVYTLQISFYCFIFFFAIKEVQSALGADSLYGCAMSVTQKALSPIDGRVMRPSGIMPEGGASLTI
jgi:hypothetical protein